MVLGHGAPEDLASRFVIPDLRQAQRDDEGVASVEHALGFKPHRLVIAQRLGVIAVPEVDGGLAVLPGPFELLADGVAVHDPIAHHRDIGLGGVGSAEQEAELLQIVGDVGGEAGAEGDDVGLGVERRLGRHQAVRDVSAEDVVGLEAFVGGIEVGRLAAIVGIGRLADLAILDKQDVLAV